MAPTTNGLTNGGATTHYNFTYDDSLSAPLNPTGPEPARTNGVIAACESDFNLMAGWFGNIALDVPTPIPVNVTQNGGGAGWNLNNGNLTITINPDTRGASHIRYLLVSEMVEQFMRAQQANRADNWFGAGTEGSNGEGLSRFLGAQCLAVNGLGNPPTDFRNSNLWLQTTRQDYVNTNPPGASTDDGPDAVTGCALLFIYYLFGQLGYSVDAIVGAGASTLAGVYKNLTGDSDDPFPAFSRLLNIYYPGTATISGPNLDNPFPLQEEQQHTFYRGTDGAINHIFWHPTNQFYWDQWTSRAGAPLAEGNPATMVWPNQQHVFYRGADGYINHIFWDSPSNGIYWDQWTQKAGAPPAAGDPATMVWPGQQHVLYRGRDGSINHFFWDQASNGLYWEHWTQRT